MPCTIPPQLSNSLWSVTFNFRFLPLDNRERLTCVISTAKVSTCVPSMVVRITASPSLISFELPTGRGGCDENRLSSATLPYTPASVFLIISPKGYSKLKITPLNAPGEPARPCCTCSTLVWSSFPSFVSSSAPVSGS